MTRQRDLMAAQARRMARGAETPEPPEWVRKAAEHWKRRREDYGQRLSEARRRAEIVRRMTGWIQGRGTPPDGATAADVLARGIGWPGWEWVRRGWNVSPEARRTDAERAERVLDTLKETKGGGIYSRATGQLIAGRNLLPPWELEALRACVPIVEEWRAALDDEGAAWEEWERARRNAADTLPIDEIEAARERLAAAKAGGGEPEAPAEIPPKAGKGGDGKRHKRRPVRGKYEVTQEEAAKQLGVSVRTLRQWEAGGATPRNAEGYTKDKRRTQAGFCAYVVGLRRDLSTVENLRANVGTLQLGNRMGMGTRKRP